MHLASNVFCVPAFAFGALRELYNSKGNRGEEWVVTKQKLRRCRIRFTCFSADHTEIGCHVNWPLACEQRQRNFVETVKVELLKQGRFSAHLPLVSFVTCSFLKIYDFSQMM